MKKNEKEILLQSSCLGCCIRLIAFRRFDHDDASLYITTLSDHVYQWQKSWRGRFDLAKRALRGKINEDIACETIDEMKQLHEAIGDLIEFCESKDEQETLGAGNRTGNDADQPSVRGDG